MRRKFNPWALTLYSRWHWVSNISRLNPTDSITLLTPIRRAGVHVCVCVCVFAWVCERRHTCTHSYLCVHAYERKGPQILPQITRYGCVLTSPSLFSFELAFRCDWRACIYSTCVSVCLDVCMYSMYNCTPCSLPFPFTWWSCDVFILNCPCGISLQMWHCSFRNYSHKNGQCSPVCATIEALQPSLHCIISSKSITPLSEWLKWCQKMEAAYSMSWGTKAYPYTVISIVLMAWHNTSVERRYSMAPSYK